MIAAIYIYILKTMIYGILDDKLGLISKSSTIDIEVGDENNDEIGMANQIKMDKSENMIQPEKPEMRFLIPGTKLVFVKLKQAFIKASILHNYDPKYFIQIETDVSCYFIGKVLSQLTVNDLGQWHLWAFFSWKMILIKT